MSRPKKILSTDIFVLLNTVLFLAMCATVYFDRFIQYRGYANIIEFFIYAICILLVIFAIWSRMRAVYFPAWILFLIQVGILMHFSGAFFPIDGGRLYDARILGLRYDKYVHCFNAFAGSALVSHILDRSKLRTPMMGLVVLMVVLGAGAVVEIVEYLVTRTVPHNGVGDYDNNMQDLLSNLVGGILFFVVVRIVQRFREREMASSAELD